MRPNMPDRSQRAQSTDVPIERCAEEAAAREVAPAEAAEAREANPEEKILTTKLKTR